MHYQVIAAGKASLSYAKSGIEEYSKRLRRYGRYEIKYIKDGTSDAVSQRLFEASAGSFRIALDERGESLTTAKLHNHFSKLELRGDIKTVSFLIGASDGHTEELRQQCDLVLNLSTLTLQHELALVVLLEQLYRLATMARNEPYHR